MVLFYSHKKGAEYACFSNWYPAEFELNGYHYWCSEQAMMAGKARLFEDWETADKIMAATTQKEIKQLGREVTPFDKEIWNANCRQIVYDALVAKFSQNLEMKEELLSTGDDIIAESSPNDLNWGIGKKKNDPKALDPKSWRGKNWLGYTLMEVRETLKKTTT